MGKVLINDTTLTAIGNAIRSKNETTNTYKPSQMPNAIMNLSTGIPLPFEVTGDCYYRFSSIGWNNFISNYEITTKDITTIRSMFSSNKTIQRVPFEINTGSSWDGYADYVFNYCESLIEVPKINMTVPVKYFGKMFYNCHNLRELPNDFVSWFDLSNLSSGPYYEMFSNCYSLRNIPVEIFNTPITLDNHNSTYFDYLNYLYAIDELTNLPLHCDSESDYNDIIRGQFCNNLYRLKNLTFEPNKTFKSDSLYINLTNYVGYAKSEGDILNYNSGCSAGTRIIDDETYNRLKDHPDAWTTDIAYSRYNHDSAVATINSLPTIIKPTTGTFYGCSINFKGASGSATDGGAIDNLTAEEIAVATAKNWTVTIS